MAATVKCLVLALALGIGGIWTDAVAAEQVAAERLKVELTGAQAGDSQSQQVLDALKRLLEALGQKNIEAVAACLSPDVVLIDQRNHKTIYGKDAVVEHVKNNVLGGASGDGVKSISVRNPFVAVKGDTAMVSFHAFKEMGGAHPAKFESFCSEIFELKDGEWKVLHFKSNWTPLK